MKTFKLMLVVLGLLCSLYLQASSTYDFKVDGIYYNILSSTDYTCSVTYGSSDYNSYSGDVVIPEQVTYKGQTYKVTAIGSAAFQKSTQMTSVSMPNSITKIGTYAFYKCTSLKSIVIPPLVTELGTSCFSDCEDLASIDLANVTTIKGGSTFYNCSSLEHIFMPKSVSKISSAFGGCKSLQTVIFEDGSEELELDRSMFSDCSLDSAYLGRNISDSPFMYNKSLRSIYISDAVTSLPAQPFYNCTNLQYVYGMNNITSIPHYTFLGCTSLKNFVVSNKVTALGSDAFSGCTALENLVIGDGIEKFNAYSVLANCKNLKNLYIGKGLKEFTNNASSNWASVNLFLFSETLSTSLTFVGKGTHQNGSSYTYTEQRVPLTTVIYVIDPSRYETIMEGYNVKRLLTFNETSMEYTGRTPELTYKNNVEGMEVSFDSSTTPKDAGSYNTELDVTFSMSDWQTTVQIPCAYTVTKAPLSIMTNNAQCYYGEDNPELTCEYVGFKNGETAEVLDAQPTVYTTATKDSYVGTYPIYCTGAEAKNYTITTQNGTLTIIKAPQTITWEQDFTGVHVGDYIELTATASSGLNVKYRSSDQTAVLITTQNGKQYAYILKEGIAAITAYQSGDTNHEEADEVTLLVNATVTGINGIQADTDQDATYYNTSGQRVSQPNGLTIVRQANGTTRKVVK